MKVLPLVLFVFLFWTPPLKAQATFSKAFDFDDGIDIANAIRVVDDGYVIMGRSTCTGGVCLVIFKTDFHGNILWQRIFTNSDRPIQPGPWVGCGNNGIAAKPGSDELFFTGVLTRPNSTADAFLIKTDANGELLWQKTTNNSNYVWGYDVFYSSDSTIMTFNLQSVLSHDHKLWLREYDLDGTQVFGKIYNDTFQTHEIHDIIQLENNELVYTTSHCLPYCVVLDSLVLRVIKLNEFREMVWRKDLVVFHPLDFWNKSAILQLDNGGFLVSFYRREDDAAFWFPPVLLWLDADGNIMNETHFPTETERDIFDIFKTKSGNIVAVGLIDRFDLGIGGWVVSFTQEGEMLWSREIIDTRWSPVVSMFVAGKEAENGGIIIGGQVFDTVTLNGQVFYDENMLLIKLDSNGCLNPGCGEMEFITLHHEPENYISGVSVFPNPVSDKLYVDLPSDFRHAIIRIYDFLGIQLLMVELEASVNEINLITTGLQRAGIYSYTIESGGGIAASGKFLFIP